MKIEFIKKLRFAAVSVAVAAISSAAMAEVTVSFSQISYRKAMEEIQKVSNLHFFYNVSLKGLDSKVSLSVKNASERSALDKLFADSQLDYTLKNDNTVVVYQKGDATKGESRKNTKEQKDSRKKIKGVVTDEKGEPLVGVTMKVRNSNKAVVTDLDGKFSLEDLQKGDVIELTYVGYAPKSVKIDDSSSYDIRLQEMASDLDDVVVVGYGSQKKVNLTGAVSVVTAKDLNGRPTGNAATALQGADPSLNLSMGSGGPDSDVSINIRGVTSINGGKPLILVDGVEMDLTRVNANDIESVSILKDASAAAVYGAKASAGVVLVTTKSGQNDSRARVSFDLKAGWKRQTTSSDYITSGFWQMYLNESSMYNDQSRYFLTGYGDNEYAQMWMRLDDKTENPERPWCVPTPYGHWMYYANYDWYSHYFRKDPPMQDYNVSVTGGSKKVNYYVSGRAYLEDGMLAKGADSFKSYSFRAKVNARITDWLTYRVNTSFFNSHYDHGGTSDLNNFLYKALLHTYAAFPSTNPDGTSLFQFAPGLISMNAVNMGAGYNAMLNYNKHKTVDRQNEALIKNTIEIRPLSWWKIIGEYAYLFRNTTRSSRYVNVPFSRTEGEIEWIDEGYDKSSFTDKFVRNMTNTTRQTINAYMEFDPSFGDHNLKATVGFNGEIYRYLYFKAGRQDLMSQDVSSLNIATGEYTEVIDKVNNAVTYGFFGRVNYDYAGKYLIEVSGRYDGTSRFAKNHRWGFFPSASVGWRFSEEKFFEPLHPVWSNGKLRASYGMLGNQQVGYYDYILEMTTNQANKGITFDGESYIYYANVSDPVADDLTWEKVITYNLGLDLGFFNNRLGVSGDFYIRDTKDMLTSGAQLPDVYGATVPNSNCADLRTKGYELSVNWTDNFHLLGSPFTYSVGAGLGDQISKITKFDNPEMLLGKHYVGETLGEIWGYRVAGLFRTEEEAQEYQNTIDCKNYVHNAMDKGPNPGLHAGDVKFIDINGDGAITPGNSKVGDSGDRVIIGNKRPRYNYNFRGSLQWKGIDISAFFQGVGKCDWYPGNEARTFWGPYCRPFIAFIPEGFQNEIWTEDNPDAYFPRLRTYQAYSGKRALNVNNDRYLQDVSYLRLKNLTVGYTLPVWKNVFNELRIYFSAENLAYWSPFKKHCKTIDPETATKSGTKSNDGMVYGFSKSFTFGVNVTF